MDSDYLIVGAGAMGMAFADTILNETEAATVTIVDKHARPGGHWNDAYPFVRLHQPSAFYGVNSRPLGDDRIDVVGWNAGMYELASGAEVLTYYDHLMHRDFLPSGRVRYLPMSEYDTASHDIVSLTTAERTNIDAATLVDASYMKVSVPSQRPPSYVVADGVHCAPLNELPNIAQPTDGYVVIGAGKTGADACLWLLKNGVNPGDIRWVMPRDSWYSTGRESSPASSSNVPLNASSLNFATLLSRTRSLICFSDLKATDPLSSDHRRHADDVSLLDHDASRTRTTSTDCQRHTAWASATH